MLIYPDVFICIQNPDPVLVLIDNATVSFYLFLISA
jgi:hypothetical protein